MLRLIVRDLFMYQRNNFFVLIGFALLNTFLLRQGDSGVMGFTICLLGMSLFAFTMTAQTTLYYDELSKSNRFFRAMPIPPSSIVRSRYASCFLSAAMGILALYIVAALVNVASLFYPFLYREVIFNIDLLILCLAAVLIFCAALLPLLFKFGYMKSKYPLMLLFIALASCMPMALSSGTQTQKELPFLSFLPTIGTSGIVFILALLALYGSIRLSMAIFARKEV
ncbi:hypothetical protein Sgly_1661 [Syntrophobotulus glycolicus DSM 8271]|uniref:ABC-2 transporter permease n=1 Tax=Syntrophobotulus glycolicus (strain DSM 8271 / FlGlyR) TaxID=645991 RepID=F0SYC4_SYNGF|nr:ABC-2 transporter permease [Syntrophobotulus glycolicus]ADY55959.1 hypothetical protein Sgly_1661 [Syntrophobotulus glycolicus DSM 8271]